MVKILLSFLFQETAGCPNSEGSSLDEVNSSLHG